VTQIAIVSKLES